MLVAVTREERRARPAKRRTQKYSDKEEKYPTRIGTKNDPCPWHLTRHRPAQYRAQHGKEPPEADKQDPEFDKWKQKRRPKKEVAVPELYCIEDGTLNLCRECFLHWLSQRKPGKGHNGGLFCCHKRHKEAKRREEDRPAKRNKTHVSKPTPEPASKPASEPASGPASEPAVEQQVQPSNVVPASVSAPQQLLQPLNVEPTVQQPQQQATGLDVQVQVMGESAEPSKPPETQQPSDKPAESVGDGNNFDIPDGFVAVIRLQDNLSNDNFSNSTNDSWKSFGRFIDGVETHADTADTADAQAIPGMSLDDASDL